MSQQILDLVEKPVLKTEVPKFAIGDTVDVHTKILEGDKERIQVFTGVVIARSGSGSREMFTVRRMVANEGVERKFPLHSPKIDKIEVVRSGEVRRAKLYFLRGRTGKSVRLKERRRETAERHDCHAHSRLVRRAFSKEVAGRAGRRRSSKVSQAARLSDSRPRC